MNINTYFDKIFYINLAKDTDRNKYVLAQFEKFNITNFERIDAISYTEVPYKNLWRNFNKTDDKYVLGQLGCSASKLKIIKLAKERNYKKILIFEDDIKILVDPNELLKINESILNDLDFLYFGGFIESFFRNQIVCAHAYGLSHKVFDDIINMAIPSGMEMDNFYAKVMQHMSYNHNQSGMYNTRILLPFDTIIQNKDFNSNISSEIISSEIIRPDLEQLTDLIKPYFKPNYFMEVGSRNGHDTEYIERYWGINPENCHIIEADEKSYNNIINSYNKYNVYNLAASNENCEVEFLSVDSEKVFKRLDNLDDVELIRGLSSIKKSIHTNNLPYKKNIIKSIRLDAFNFQIDLVKIDVEGHGYEVLEGLGDKLKKIKAIQIETEEVPCFENQKIDSEVHKYLLDNGFSLIDKKRCWHFQFDCLYINDYIL